MNPSILPVMGYSVEGDGSLSQVDLKKIAKYQIKPYLLATEGVSDIAVIGGKDKEYEIILKPYALQNLQISIKDIQDAVNNSNILQSNGYITDYDRMYLNLTNNAIENLADLENVVVKSSTSRTIRLKDIAEIQVNQAKEYVKVLANGKNVPLLAIIKQPDANLIEVNNNIEKKVAELGSIIPKNVRIRPFYKQANFVNSSIRSIKDVLWIGLVLAILVVIIFLRSFSASMVIVFSIPLSLALTLLVMDAVGYTFNIMTLGAIAAAIGLMIDDVVIVIEQIHKIREEHPKKTPQLDRPRSHFASISCNGWIVAQHFAHLRAFYFDDWRGGRLLQGDGIQHDHRSGGFLSGFVDHRSHSRRGFFPRKRDPAEKRTQNPLDP